MITTYTQALAWLYQQPLGRAKKGLTHLNNVLAKYDSPHLSAPVIHVAGTNGKGSTIAFLKDILQAHRKRVLVFTSPHLERFNERIVYQNQQIPDDYIVTYCQLLQDDGLTQFELMTCFCFLYMAEVKPDVAIIEVGIGGLLDATNVVESQLSVITTIDLDHTGLLGQTLSDIAYQKAGIIKKNSVAILGQLDADSEQVIQQYANTQQATLYHSEKVSYYVQAQKSYFTWHDTLMMIQMIGAHQVNNACLALASAHLYLGNAFQIDAAKQAVAQTYWPGRMEQLDKSGRLYVDGAHNIAGIQALKHVIDTQFKHKKVTILFAALQRKDYQEMIVNLQTITDTTLVVTSFAFAKAATQAELLAASQQPLQHTDDWYAYVQDFMTQPTDDVLIVTGSLYFIAEVKQRLDKRI